MKNGVHRRILEFVEQEKASEIDQELLTKLRSYVARETLYWQLPPSTRKTFNTFLRDLHDEFIREVLFENYGASIVLESLLVSAFEAGYWHGKEEGEP